MADEINTGGGAGIEGNVDAPRGFAGRDAPSQVVHVQAPPDFASTVLFHLTQISTKVEGLDQKVNGINEKVIGQAAEIQHVKVELNRQGREQTVQTDRIRAIETDITQLKSAWEESRRDRADLRDKVNEVKNEVRKIPDRIPTPEETARERNRLVLLLVGLALASGVLVSIISQVLDLWFR